jgi:hypothetical protein
MYICVCAAAVSFILCRMGFGMWLAYSATVNITPFVAQAHAEGKSFEATLGQVQYWLMIVSRCVQVAAISLPFPSLSLCVSVCVYVPLFLCLSFSVSLSSVSFHKTGLSCGFV